jgi:hypothetical protein
MDGTLKFSGAVMILLLFLGPASNIALDATNDPSNSTALAESCQNAAATTYNAMNQASAISNAMSSQEYTHAVVGYQNTTYNSIFQLDKTTSPYPTCTDEVLSYNVVFTLTNSTGGWAGYLVITESQDLAVIGSALQTNASYATNHYPNWASYEVSDNSPATQAVYQAYTEFIQPTATDPTGGCGNAGSCNIGNWAGLEDKTDATDGNLEQDGTLVSCTVHSSSCTNTYVAWYQNYENGANPLVNCSASNGGAVTISGGNTIVASTTNEAYSGGSDTKYDFYIADLQSDTDCYVTAIVDSSFTKPLYGVFVVENVLHKPNGYYQPLAGFSSSEFFDASIYTGGSSEYINNYIWGASNMENAPVIDLGLECGTYINNVQFSSLSSDGTFTMTYNSSQYTPAYGNTLLDGAWC